MSFNFDIVRRKAVLNNNTNPLLDNIISYYPFNANSNDYFSLNNGTGYSVTYEASPIVGNSLSKASSVSSYVEIPSSYSLNFGDGVTDKPFSISFWVKKNSTSRVLLLGKVQTQIEYYFNVDNNQLLRFFICSNGSLSNRIEISHPTPLSLNTYNHIVGTYDGSGVMKLYVNNVKASLQVETGTYVAMSQTNSPIYIGQLYNNSSWSSSSFNMDELYFFDKKLSDTEVEEIYNKGLNNQNLL